MSKRSHPATSRAAISPAAPSAGWNPRGDLVTLEAADHPGKDRIMHVLTVCYGHPADPAAFDAYYTSTHVPLAEKIPGMTSYTYRHCASLDGSQPPYHLIAELSWPSQEAMGAALT